MRILMRSSLTDPGFSRGLRQPVILQNFAENRMKMKELDWEVCTAYSRAFLFYFFHRFQRMLLQFFRRGINDISGTFYCFPLFSKCYFPMNRNMIMEAKELISAEPN